LEVGDELINAVERSEFVDSNLRLTIGQDRVVEQQRREQFTRPQENDVMMMMMMM